MPKMARSYKEEGYYGYRRPYPSVVTPKRPQLRPIPPKKVFVKKKVNLFSKLISFVFLVLIGIYPIPYTYHIISKPLLFGVSYPEIRVNYNDFLKPTTNYLSNDIFLNTRLLTPSKLNKPEMANLYTTEKMPALEAKLFKLMSEYKIIDPSIFVWDYDTGKYVDIKASKIYSSASIIKIPILIQLFKSIEANQLTIYDEMILTNY